MDNYSKGEEIKFSNDRLLNIFLLLTIVAFLICSSYFLNIDFWQDEIYTIDHFVFQSWKTIFTDYHSTNNHILFNIFLKLVLTFAGITEIKYVLEYPIILRIVPFIFSILSIFFLYKSVNKFYNSAITKITLSVYCTTIVFIDFSCQLRGYSLSILITILIFSTILKILQNGRRRDAYFLFFLILSSLICLPTNIYLALSFLFISILLFVSEDVRNLYFFNGSKKRILSQLIQPIIAAMIISIAYYMWLLSMQLENELVTSYNLFSFKNAVQAFAVLYHFMDYRYYFLIYFIIWMFLFLLNRKNVKISNILLPAALYLLPFLIFYFHGAIIIQRVFLSQLPFFALVAGIIIHEVNLYFSKKALWHFILIINVLLLGFSFKTLISDSTKNIKDSNHQHDLRGHYYLVNFNAKEAALLASELSRSFNKKLIVWDDFGETGIKYYMKHFQIPYESFSEDTSIKEEKIYLVNNKREFENMIKNTGKNYKRILSLEKQYNLYLLQ